MTPEEIEIFNHNVMVDNNRSDYMLNITGILTERVNFIWQYLDDYTFAESLMIFAFVLTLIANLIFIHQLDNRITKLEENRPEKEPLLSNF